METKVKHKLDCNLIVLGTKVLLETACNRNLALKVFDVDETFQCKVLDYLWQNEEINILNKDSFNFLT